MSPTADMLTGLAAIADHLDEQDLTDDPYEHAVALVEALEVVGLRIVAVEGDPS